MYNKSYSQTGYAQSQSRVLFASASSNFEITSNLKSLNFLFESFQTSQYLQSNLKSVRQILETFQSNFSIISNFDPFNFVNAKIETNLKFNSNYQSVNVILPTFRSVRSPYSRQYSAYGYSQSDTLEQDVKFHQTRLILDSSHKSTSILDISFFSSMFLNSNFTEMNLALFRGQTNFKFNSNYNNLNITFEKYDSNFKLVSNFTDLNLVLEKFQTLQNLNSQVNARHFSVISSLHYSIERLNSNYKIMIPGRLIFRGKVWSQSPDDPIY